MTEPIELPPSTHPEATHPTEPAQTEHAPADDPEERARDEFEALVERAIAAIPEPFASQLEGVAIVIDDDPAPGQVPGGRSVLGLYEGIPRTAEGARGAPHAARISIFRRPHEWAYRDPVARAQAVENTVLHEIAHHLGIDEENIRRIEAGRKRPGTR